MVAHDLSTGGMQVTSSQPMWPGQLVRLRFRLPKTNQYIRCTCRVAGLTDVPHGHRHELDLHAPGPTGSLADFPLGGTPLSGVGRLIAAFGLRLMKVVRAKTIALA